MGKPQHQIKPENLQVLEKIKKETDEDRSSVLQLTGHSRSALTKFEVKEQWLRRDNIKHLNTLTFEKRRFRLYVSLLLVFSPFTVFLSLFFVPLMKDKVSERTRQIESLLKTIREINVSKNSK